MAAARRLNELGLRGVGGRTPTHGMRMLKPMLKRGDVPEGQVAQLLAEHEHGYLTDIGGRENVSTMEAGICKR